jgi:hypothetical protein
MNATCQLFVTSGIGGLPFSLMSNRMRARYYFRHDDVFDPSDRMARYVMRLSIALGDLRVVAHYATRSRQPAFERLYFVRLLASHIREVVLIMDPPDPTLPTIEEFLRALPRRTEPKRWEIRASHRHTLRLLRRGMDARRPPIEKKGEMVRPRLRDDLRELRNRFFHYGHDASGDTALEAAMTSLAGDATGYVIRERTMRALYADDVSMKLTHPYPPQFADEMHRRLVELIEPISLFVHQLEAAWLHAHQDHVGVRLGGERRRRTLREALSPRG